MNEIITKAIEQQNLSLLVDIPTEFYTDSEREAVMFALNYNSKHGMLPPITRVAESVNTFVPYFDDQVFGGTAEPLTAILEAEMRNRLKVLTLQLTAKFEEGVRTGFYNIDILHKVAELNALSDGLDRFSTYDRSNYFNNDKIPFPMSVINAHIGGLMKGDYLGLAASLGIGKSTFAQWFAWQWWQQGYKVVFISTEVLSRDVFARIDAMTAQVNPKIFRSTIPEDYKSTEFQAIMSVINDATQRNTGDIIIPKKRLMTPQSIQALYSSVNADVVIVDGLYLLRPSDKANGGGWADVKSVSNEIKQLALDSEMRVVATTQLSKQAKKDGASVENVGYSYAIPQDVNFLISIEQDLVANRLLASLLKNREGGLCQNHFTIDHDTMAITEEDKIDQDKEIDLKAWMEN